jgi:DNA-binding NarL/FixJ family response regulator
MSRALGTERDIPDATPGAQQAQLPRALVVDDDPAWQQILAEILSDAGLQVEVAGSVEGAVAALRAWPHRLAVVDLSLGGVGMPDHKGLGVLQAIRRYDPGCITILLTGFATVELAVSALTDYGAFTCLQKDMFRRAQFRDILRQVLAIAPRSPDQPAKPPSGEGMRPPHQARAGASAKPEAGGASGNGLVLLVEDDAGWRTLLGQLLTDAGYHVRPCGSYGEALGYLRRENYVLAVIDLSLASSLTPGTNQDGGQLLLKAQAEGVPSIVVSGSASLSDVERSYAERGIFAYLEKQAFDRKTFIGLVAEAASAGYAGPNELSGLTRRERDVLVLLAQGLTNKDIAGELVVSPNTVKRYLKSIFEKLDVETRAAAAARAIHAGLTNHTERR